MSNKTYILLKDLPDGAKAGDEYIKGDTFYQNARPGQKLNQSCVSYFPEQVESNPDFFKLKEEKIKVTGIYLGGDTRLEQTMATTFTTNVPIAESFLREKYLNISKAIEFAINHDGVSFGNFQSKFKYTEQDMRNCFESARLMTRCENAMCRGYKDADEYLKLISE